MYKRQDPLQANASREVEHHRVTAGEVDRIEVSGVNIVGACLLYTSDAADERSSVDLGGRRIINKKTTSIIRVLRNSREYDG